MSRRSRVLTTGLVAVVLGLPAAAGLGGSATAAAADDPGTPAYSQTKHLTRTITVQGQQIETDSRDVTVTVDRTTELRGRERVELSELADEELVTTPVGFGYRRLVDGLLRDAGVSPTVSFESQDLATIEGLVAAGLGVAIVPEPFAGQSGTSGVAIATDAAHRTIGLTWRTDRPLPAPAALVVKNGSKQRRCTSADMPTPV